MEDVWHAEYFGGFEHGAREHGETLGVVRVIAGRGAVERFAVKIGRIVYKIKSDARACARRHHRAKAILIVERDGDAAHDRLRIVQFGLAIAWEIHTDLVSEGGQGARRSEEHTSELQPPR